MWAEAQTLNESAKTVQPEVVALAPAEAADQVRDDLPTPANTLTARQFVHFPIDGERAR
jgi:hypothetical protein